MTFDIALNRKDKDLVLEVNANGFANFLVIDGADRILQKIYITLKTSLGDWFLDQSIGVPYIETVFVKQTRQSTIESILRAQILSVIGVRQILDFSMSVETVTRVLTVDFICETVEGVVKGSTKLDQIR